MNMKRTVLLILLVLVLTAGGVFGHDMGDLMLNIDWQTGYLDSDIGIRVGGTKLGDYGLKKEPFGANIGLLGTVHYYFLDFIALNAGVGIGTDINLVTYRDSPSQFEVDFAFLNVYPVIPVGLRFSFGAFALGGGITVNIPIFSYASLSGKEGTYVSEKQKDDGFIMNKYVSWYGEIGFDLSGIKGRTNGFGMLLRVSAPFSDKIGETANYINMGEISGRLEYNPFHYINIALVLQFANELGSFPISGK